MAWYYFVNITSVIGVVFWGMKTVPDQNLSVLREAVVIQEVRDRLSLEIVGRVYEWNTGHRFVWWKDQATATIEEELLASEQAAVGQSRL